MDVRISEFFAASPREQSGSFRLLLTEIKTIASKVLWREFGRRDTTLVDDCCSYVLEILVTKHRKLYSDAVASTFIYEVSKQYFLNWFKKNSKTGFIEDLVSYDDEKDDRLDFLKLEDKDDDLESMKTEAVCKFHRLIQNATDANSILVISAIIECILTQQDYNHQFLSLFLYRRTNLGYDILYNRIRKMGLNLSLSRRDYFDKVFKWYAAIEPNRTNGSHIVNEWEKRAILHFDTRNKIMRGVNYEDRHNRVNQKAKVKSTSEERVFWMKAYRGDNIEADYYKRFGRSHGRFKYDKRIAFN